MNPDATPEEYQLALAARCEALLAEGLPDIEPPRNITEAKVLQDMIRKARGMDVKASGASLSLVMPPRTLSRRQAQVIDVQPVEVDPFKVE